MTLYEYRCKSCGDQLTFHLRDMDGYGHKGDEIAYPTETCGPIKRVWSLGFQLKTTDWGH